MDALTFLCGDEQVTPGTKDFVNQSAEHDIYTDEAP